MVAPMQAPPQAPPMDPAAQMAPTPAPTPDELLQALGQVRPDLVPAFQYLMQQDPQAAQAVAAKAADPAMQPRIIAMLEELMQTIQAQGQAPPGAGAVGPGPNTAIPPNPPVEPPMPPGPMPPGPGPGPIPGGPTPMPAQPAPATPPPVSIEMARKKRQARRNHAPEFDVRDLPKNRWGDKGPKYSRVLKDAQEGRRRWEARNLRIEEDIRLYNGSRVIDRASGRILEENKGDTIHISTRPYQFVERLAGYCSAKHDAARYQAPPWADDDETRFAAQALADWWRYERHCDEELWGRRGNQGDPQMPLPRLEAGMMALMGGLAFRLTWTPEDKQHPTRYEVIPLNRVFPLAHCVTHQFSLTLGEARALYSEIDEYYPPEDESGPSDNTTVKIIGWSDSYADGQGGLWHCIAWEAGGMTGRWADPDEKSRDKWIKRPTRIDYGFNPYQYRIWGGAPYGQLDSVGDYERYRGMGVLTMLRRTFKLMDLLQSAIATGALKMVDPPKVQYYLPGTRKEDMVPHSTAPGATSYGIVGEQTQPLIFSVAGGPDGQALLAALANELADFDSPILRGGGNAESGYDRVQLNSAAGSLHINPIMDELERTYELVNSLRAELVIRKGTGEDREVDSLPYSSGARDGYDATEYQEGLDQHPESEYVPAYAQMGVMKYLTPKMVKLNGTRSKVRFDRLSLPEKQMLWSMHTQAVGAKLEDARTAMEAMGSDNPDRTLFRILSEAVVMNPTALDTMVGAAAMGSQNALFGLAWQQVLAKEAQPGPAEAGPQGTPSPPAVTGGPQGMPAPVASGPMPM